LRLKHIHLHSPVRLPSLIHSLICFSHTDRVFNSGSVTRDVFEEIGRPIVTSAMEGINGETRRGGSH
jgi:hypothetical protein